MVKSGIFWFFILLLVSCSEEKKGEMPSAISITLNKDSSAVIVNGLGTELIGSLAENDSSALAEFQSLFSVYRESGDEELKGFEPPLDGNYETVDESLVFTPDTMFSRKASYRAEVRIPSYYSVKSIPGQKKLPGSVEVKAKVFIFE